MAKSFVMALDEGTSSARAVVFDRNGNVASVAQSEFTQHYPQPGWVEHDPIEIWTKQLAVAREAIAKAKISASEIAAIGITNQRETTVVWDRATGKPIYNAIVWQDRRTAGICDALNAKGLAPYVAKNTGLVIDAYFSGSKIQWILDHIPGARERAEQGQLAFGTIDSWLIWNLTGGRVHVTDYSNVSRTMLFNIRKLDWDETLLAELRIPRAILPQVRDSSEIYGATAPGLFDGEIPVAASIGDQQGALFGQACFSPGMVKCTFGTGATLMMNTGDQPIMPERGLLSSIAVGMGGKVQYSIEGLLFATGVAVQWLRDELKIIRSSSEAIVTTPDTNGVYFVPAFIGLAAPHWDQYARGTIVGLTRGANREHLIRAALEATAYQIRDVADALREVTHLEIRGLKVDGGACVNDFLMQFTADMVNTDVLRPTVLESSARGAAFLAGIATGVWSGREELTSTFELEHAFHPHMSAPEVDAHYQGWARAVERSRDWAPH